MERRLERGVYEGVADFHRRKVRANHKHRSACGQRLTCVLCALKTCDQRFDFLAWTPPGIAGFYQADTQRSEVAFEQILLLSLV